MRIVQLHLVATSCKLFKCQAEKLTSTTDMSVNYCKAPQTTSRLDKTKLITANGYWVFSLHIPSHDASASRLLKRKLTAASIKPQPLCPGWTRISGSVQQPMKMAPPNSSSWNIQSLTAVFEWQTAAQCCRKWEEKTPGKEVTQRRRAGNFNMSWISIYLFSLIPLQVNCSALYWLLCKKIWKYIGDKAVQAWWTV